MANTAIKLTYVIEIPSSEYRLILKALAGNLEPDEKEEAQALCDNLSRQRQNQVKDMIEKNERLLINIGNK